MENQQSEIQRKQANRRVWIFVILVVALLALAVYVWKRTAATHSQVTGGKPAPAAQQTSGSKEKASASPNANKKSAEISSNTTASVKPALTVNAVSVQPQNWERTLEATGNVAAWQEAIVGSEISGLRLVNIKVAIGNRVKRGQVLAELATETVEADLAQAKAGLAEAQAALSEAQANAERARNLQPSGALSAQQINQYLTAEQTAKARVEAARAQVKVQEVRMRQTKILAPDDGVISARSATLGAVVQGGQELFRLIRKERLEWRAEIAAADIKQIREGMQVQIVAADGTALSGRVRMIGPVVDAQTRNALVYVDIEDKTARAGMFARGTFALGQGEVQTLPQSAVQLRDGFSYVYQLESANSGIQKVTQRKITTGRRVGDGIAVLDGLPAQAVVVASGVGFLVDGDTVNVVPTAAAAVSTTSKP